MKFQDNHAVKHLLTKSRSHLPARTTAPSQRPRLPQQLHRSFRFHRTLRSSAPPTQQVSRTKHTSPGGFCRHLCACLLCRPHTKYQSSSKQPNRRGFSSFSAATATSMTPGGSSNHLSRCICMCFAYTARKAACAVRLRGAGEGGGAYCGWRE